VTGALLLATWGYALQRRIAGVLLAQRVADRDRREPVTVIPALLPGADARMMVIVLAAAGAAGLHAAYRYAYRFAAGLAGRGVLPMSKPNAMSLPPSSS